MDESTICNLKSAVRKPSTQFREAGRRPTPTRKRICYLMFHCSVRLMLLGSVMYHISGWT